MKHTIIGFDAKRAYQNRTGLGNYSRTLLTSLEIFYPTHQYRLFAPKQTDMFQPFNPASFRTVTPQWQPAKQFPSLWRSLWMTRDLKKNGVTLYHGLSNELPPGTHKVGIRTVVTKHHLIFERFPNLYHRTELWAYKTKFKQACKQADIIVATSRQTKQDIIEFYNVNPHKIQVCYQSCDPVFSTALTQDKLDAIRLRYLLPTQYFLYVGSIIEHKRLKLICEALRKLRPNLTIPLVVVGHGKQYKKEIQQWLAEHGMTQQVLFLSDTARHQQIPEEKIASDLPGIYQNATAFIYPSVFEGFGIPVLEGLHSEIPVITTATSSLPELGGDAAFYFHPDDLDGLCGAMLDAVTNFSLIRHKQGIATLHLEQFSLQNTANSMMKIYQSLL